MGGRDPGPDILVIEDDPAIADFLVDLLRFEGYRVLALREGKGLDEVMAAPPRMVLLDLMLPEPDGVEICRRLRADARTRALPIVIMTAASPAMRARRLRGCAYDALLAKPFDLDEVLAVVARYLRADPAPFAAADAGDGAAGR